ncbi:MAG: NAD(P)H-dependent oxidoreductase [Roseburia sp.]|nr:NAD(P)H-dependent oxidoreductase [Ruminococcus sp.]MCM1156802.1 NAD(P)H-dependent oxidoreductase [Roseburia sp.]MCM1243612.1 NAD(P)H-dependent oxidoreductase [Roseburia sp.]
MKILVINGSPKGKNSVTFQTVRFLQRKFPKDDFEIIHAGAQIALWERDMSSLKASVEAAQMILFAYPVYTFIAPSQLHRFVACLKEQDIDFSGKYVTQITTSKHFYDITAHRYIEDNCKDMGMRVLRGFSADMNDLLTRKGQLQVITYWNYLKHIIEEETSPFEEEPDTTPLREKSRKHRIIIVTDCAKENKRLRGMIVDFRKALPYESHVVNLQNFEFKGGCLGCFHCAADGSCIYQDGFDDFLRNKIQRSDSIVYAFSIKDHSMGTLFKTYDDRQFCNGHRTVTMGKPTAYLIDGEFSQEENLQMIIEARSQVGGNYLAGIATNEGVGADSPKACAKKLAYALDHRMKVNENFYGVGGMKIFRDLIFEMQGMMKADHQFYKQHHFYDFPQKKVGTILFMKFVGLLLRMPHSRAMMQSKMTEGMLMPYERVITGKQITLD